MSFVAGVRNAAAGMGSATAFAILGVAVLAVVPIGLYMVTMAAIPAS